MLAVDGVVCDAAGAELVELLEFLQDGSVPSIFSILGTHLSVQCSAWR